MALFAVVAMMIGRGALPFGAFVYVLLLTAMFVTRMLYVLPERTEQRNATRGLRVVWYLSCAELISAGVGFALAVDKHGSIPGGAAAFACALVLEVVASRMQRAEYLRLNVIIPFVRGERVEEAQTFVAEAAGPSNEALKRALAAGYSHIPTVVRAYLVTSRRANGGDFRVVAIRYAFPWVDEDAVRLSLFAFNALPPDGEGLTVVGLNEPLERRVRTVALPFYSREEVPRANVR